MHSNVRKTKRPYQPLPFFLIDIVLIEYKSGGSLSFTNSLSAFSSRQKCKTSFYKFRYLNFRGQLDFVGFLGERTFYIEIKVNIRYSLTIWKLVIEFNSIRILDCKIVLSNRDFCRL